MRSHLGNILLDFAATRMLSLEKSQDLTFSLVVFHGLVKLMVLLNLGAKENTLVSMKVLGTA